MDKQADSQNTGVYVLNKKKLISEINTEIFVKVSSSGEDIFSLDDLHLCIAGWILGQLLSLPLIVMDHTKLLLSDIHFSYFFQCKAQTNT